MKKTLLLTFLCTLFFNSSYSQSITRLLAASPFDDILRVLDTNSYLTISSKTLAFTTTSLGSVAGCNGLARNPSTGVFYIVAKQSSGRYLGVLDPLTGSVTALGNLNDNFAQITFNNNNTLLGVTGDGASVSETAFRINQTTAATSIINALGNGNDGEVICNNPFNNRVYHWSGNGTVVYEKFDTTFVTPTNIPVGSYSGEVFGAVYKTAGKFIINNINSDFIMVDTLGNFGTPITSYSTSLKGLAYITCPRLITGTLSFCGGSSTTLSITSTGDTYQWYMNNTLITGATSQTYAANSAGYYKCMISDVCGMDSTAAGVTVQQLNTPVVSISGVDTICANSTTTLTGSSGGTSQWYLNGALISGATSNTIAVTSGGVYNMIKTNTNGCADSASVGKVITISPTPTITIVASPTIVCAGASLTLTASGANTYSWNTTTNGSTISVSPSANTNYSLVGADANLCEGSASIAVAVNPLPTITATSNNNVICEGEIAILTANGGSTYVWENGSPNATISVSPTTTTSYSLIGTDSFGCSNTFTISQTVSPCTGINLVNSKVSALSIYPNPNNGEFIIQNDKALNLELMDDLGRFIKTISLTESNNYSVDLSNLSAGIYFVIGIQHGETIKAKIIVSK